MYQEQGKINTEVKSWYSFQKMSSKKKQKIFSLLVGSPIFLLGVIN